MKTLKLLPFTLAVLLGMAGTVEPATIESGDAGIGTVAKITFDKKDLKSDAPEISIHTGTNFTPPEQNIPYAKHSIVPPTKSDAWCDPHANPMLPDNTNYDLCYGNAYDARWVLLDFNKLKKQGVGKVEVDITARRYLIGDANLPSNFLVPGLTVFQGRQDQGAWGSWFPNMYQTSPQFWGWELTPFTGGTTESLGWASGYSDTGSLDTVTVSGNYFLKGNPKNYYLTVGVGGDARDGNENHDVNFELLVKVKKYVAPVGPTTNCGFPQPYDACGCPPGTHWHPQMGHCMADDRFTGEYKGQEVTGAQCEACGCKRTLAYGKCP